MDKVNESIIHELMSAIDTLTATVESLRTVVPGSPVAVTRNEDGLLVPEADENDVCVVDPISNKMTKAQIIEKYDQLANMYKEEHNSRKQVVKLCSLLEKRVADLAKDSEGRLSRSESDALKQKLKALDSQYSALHEAHTQLKYAVNNPDVITVNKSDLDYLSDAVLDAIHKPEGLMFIQLRKICNMIRQLMRDGSISRMYRR